MANITTPCTARGVATVAKVGMAIATAWLILHCGGRWRASRGWRDHLGLARGTAWIFELLWATVLEPIAQIPQ